MDACPKARKALSAEWEKLRFLKRPHPVQGQGAWGEGNVREASSVRDAARAAGNTVHFGRIVEPCHEKGSELALDDPERKMKGRSVLLGDNIKDQDFNWAEFCELGSSPPSVDAATTLDAFGSFPGYTVITGDAKGAYTQALLLGAETWVTLPENRWHKHWKGKFPSACRSVDLGPLRSCRRRWLLGSPLRGKALAHRMDALGRGMARRFLA
jgi:hypothetical protein